MNLSSAQHSCHWVLRQQTQDQGRPFSEHGLQQRRRIPPCRSCQRSTLRPTLLWCGYFRSSFPALYRLNFTQYRKLSMGTPLSRLCRPGWTRRGNNFQAQIDQRHHELAQACGRPHISPYRLSMHPTFTEVNRTLSYLSAQTCMSLLHLYGQMSVLHLLFTPSTTHHPFYRHEAVNLASIRGYSVNRQIAIFIYWHFGMPLLLLEAKLDACGGAIAGRFLTPLLKWFANFCLLDVFLSIFVTFCSRQPSSLCLPHVLRTGCVMDSK